MQLTEERVKVLYAKYKRKAEIAFHKHHYDDCLMYIKAAAHTGYNFYLGYKDENLEEMLVNVSKALTLSPDQPNRKDDVCVFYDSFSIDNGGLVQQYLGAIISAGYKILYITEKVGFATRSSAIKSILEEYGKVEIVEIPHKLSYFKTSQFIYDTIIRSSAKKLFMQTGPSSASAIAAINALPKSIVKYKINLTDHTFWIGARRIDYSLEFRPFGCVLSYTYRGIPKEKVFLMQFYPIMNHSAFQGYPKEAEGKVVIFSGGAYYKIYDKEDTYFKIAKAILDVCKNAVILFAGTGNRKALDQKLTEYGIIDRFIPIGQRTDITEVFEHCDIYLNTYPFGGGLMSQYAAQLSKPIVNYSSKVTAKVEELVCQVKQMNLSDITIKALSNRVQQLVADKKYRKEYGAKIHDCALTSEYFNQLFVTCMSTNMNAKPYSDDVSFEEHTMDIKDKLDFENKNFNFHRRIIKVFGWRALVDSPDFLFVSICAVLREKRLFMALLNKIKYGE
jgi:hypothetical protein